MVSVEDVYLALRRVTDPELGVNVVDLGLVYGVEVEDGRVEVAMTVTTPGCPLQDVLPRWVEEAVAVLPGVTEVRVGLVLDPPWTPEMMTDRAREELGL